MVPLGQVAQVSRGCRLKLGVVKVLVGIPAAVQDGVVVPARNQIGPIHGVCDVAR